MARHPLARRIRHPKAKPVITPSGRYLSASIAAEQLHMHPTVVSTRCRLGKGGWSYVEPEDSANTPQSSGGK